LVSIVGAAVFSKMNIEKHETQLAQTNTLKAKVKGKKQEVATKEGELQDEEALRTEAKDTNNSLLAEKDLRENDVKDNKKLSASFDDDLEELVGKKDEIQKAIAEIEKELKGEKVPLEQVEEYVTGLENKKKDLNKTNIALQEEISIFTEAVRQNRSTLSDFKDAQLKRRKNLNANGASSLITAVDNEWGFVVVKPHADSMIKQDSKLLVIRGNRHIGRLSINAIEEEAGRVLANIDYSSIAPGMRIRPGDRVILSKPLTQ
jgi:chromosome segregation ATPase